MLGRKEKKFLRLHFGYWKEIEIELKFREPKRLMGPKVYQDGVQEANSVGIEVFTVEKVLEVEVI